MKHKILITLLYALGSSTIITYIVMAAMLSLKNDACDGVLSSVREGVIFSGPCTADGIGFIGLAAVVYIVVVLLVLLNLWAVKSIKIL